MDKIEIIPCLRGPQRQWMHDIHRAGRFVASAPTKAEAEHVLERLDQAGWKWLHLAGETPNPLELAKTIIRRGWTFSPNSSIAAYSGRTAIHRGPFWIFSGDCTEHAFVFRYWIYDEAVVAALQALLPALPVDDDKALPPAPPEWASSFDDADRYTVPVQSGLVAFYPVTESRPEALRVSYRYSSPDAWWYEVEAYKPNGGRWIELKTHQARDLAIEDASAWYRQPAGV